MARDLLSVSPLCWMILTEFQRMKMRSLSFSLSFLGFFLGFFRGLAASLGRCTPPVQVSALVSTFFCTPPVQVSALVRSSAAGRSVPGLVSFSALVLVSFSALVSASADPFSMMPGSSALSVTHVSQYLLKRYSLRVPSLRWWPTTMTRRASRSLMATLTVLLETCVASVNSVQEIGRLSRLKPQVRSIMNRAT